MLRWILLGCAVAGLAVLSALAIEGAGTSLTEERRNFAQFVKEEGKRYATPEEAEYRFSVFRENLALINAHNAQADTTYTLAVNRLADQTWAELSERYLGRFPEEKYSLCEGEEVGAYPFDPDLRSIDWVDKGKVTPIKNQGNCGSCYAFGSIAGIESALAIAGQPLEPLSEQQIVDCSHDYHNLGCGGGLISYTYHYAMDNSIVSEKDYPYSGKSSQTCAVDPFRKIVRLAGCQKAERNTSALIKYLQSFPVPVAFEANLDIFFYKFGVYNPKGCGKNVNHAVLLVGYDLDYKTPFFRIKNSWGTWWGKSGYLYLAIGTDPDGVCNVAGSGHNTFPLLTK